MGNYSTVIVTWCGAESDLQIDQVLATVPRMTLEQNMPDLAVAIFHAKNFQPDDLADCLSGMKWQYPDEVEFFWKDQERTRYEKVEVQPPEVTE